MSAPNIGLFGAGRLGSALAAGLGDQVRWQVGDETHRVDQRSFAQRWQVQTPDGRVKRGEGHVLGEHV